MIAKSGKVSRIEQSPESSDDEGKLEKSMMLSAEIEYEDKAPKKTIGDEAILDFYLHYKRMDKINDKNRYSRSKESFFSNFFKGVEKRKMLPLKLAIVKREGNNHELNLKNFYMGDKYAKAISDGMNIFKYENVKLANNRLTSKGATLI
jgi:hypothetical protein